MFFLKYNIRITYTCVINLMMNHDNHIHNIIPLEIIYYKIYAFVFIFLFFKQISLFLSVNI